MEKEWMNAPLPPLSQSIIASGLVVGDYVISEQQNIPKKRTRATSYINISAVKKSFPKNISQRTSKENSQNESNLITGQEANIKSSRSSHFCTSYSIGRKKSLKSKPIEQFHIYTQEEREQIYSEDPKEKKLDRNEFNERLNCIESLIETRKQMGNASSSSRSKSDFSTEANKRHLREETIEIENELNSNIASISLNENDIENSDVETQTEIRAKLLQYHNFSFNKLILQERTTCAERALLLRRLHKFYNQMIGDIPSLFENLRNFTSEYNSKYELLLQHSKEIESNAANCLSENENLKAQIEDLNSKVQSLTESNNQKDIQISSNAFDLDFAKCQAAQFQFKLQAESEKANTLKRTIEKLDEENKNKINRILNLEETVSKLRQNEVDLMDKLSRNTKIGELEFKIKKLEEENFNLTHIDKADAETQKDFDIQNFAAHNPLLHESVETNQQPSVKPIKRGRRGTINGNKPVFAQTTNSADSTRESNKVQNIQMTKNSSLSHSSTLFLKEEKSNGKYDFPKPKNPKRRSLGRKQANSIKERLNFGSVGIGQIATFEPIPENHPSLNLETTEEEERNEAECEPESIRKVEIEVQTESEEKGVPKDTEEDLVDHAEDCENDLLNEAEKYSQFGKPANYSTNHDILDKIPDLFEMLVPFLSQPYVSPGEEKLKFLNVPHSNQRQTDKPAVWAIQLIHSFLTDSFVRAFGNQSRDSIESIFIEWINRHYNLPHLVQQIVYDLSFILLNYRIKIPFISFFSELLMGKFSFQQLCFLSTIYTFSHEFTFPNISSLLQSMSWDDDKKPMIHLECIEKLLEKCFSKEVALQFVKKEFTDNFNDIEPMVDYLVFLQKVTDLFGQEHKSLYGNTKDLLLLCGCYDNTTIVYESFVRFFSILGFGLKSDKNNFDFKEEWKKAIKKNELNNNENIKFINLSGIVSICAEKKMLLMKVLKLDSLKISLGRIKNLSPFISDFYYSLMTKFSTLILHVFSKLSVNILAKIKKNSESLRRALLRADVATSVFLYRILVNKIDRLLMKEKGFIPFNLNCTSDILSKLIEYIERTESVSFVLVD